MKEIIRFTLNLLMRILENMLTISFVVSLFLNDVFSIILSGFALTVFTARSMHFENIERRQEVLEVVENLLQKLKEERGKIE